LSTTRVRSIEAEGIAAAEWARAVLGPGNRIGTDRINGVLMGSYGDQHLVTIAYDHVNVAIVVFASNLGVAEQTILQRGKVQYLVVDHRLSSALPLFGVYFEPGEPGSYQHTTPVDPGVLTKFDAIGNISRIYDDGDVVVYDVTDISNAP